MIPPKRATAFLRWFCREDYLEEIEGDLLEVFEKQYQSSPRKAKWNYNWTVIRYFRPGFIKSIEFYSPPNSAGMYKSYLKTAWRNITSKKLYAAINVSGLALGIACALLIFSIIKFHLGFDSFHKDSDRIYRFVTEQHRDQIDYTASVPPAFGKQYRADYTFSEKVSNLCMVMEGLASIKQGEEVKKFQDPMAFADPEFFDIFNFPLVAGKSNSLKEPNTALITERIAQKYFGNTSPVGKIFRFDNMIDFTITGVLKNIPDNTDFRSEIYLSYASIKQYSEWYAAPDAWGGITSEIQTFTRLKPGVSPAQVENTIQAYVKKYRAKSKNVHHYKLQPIYDMHFNPKYGGTMDDGTLWTLSIIGFLILLTACLNFINLATAQSITRSKEVGIRKVLGSGRGQLFWQFTVETAVIVVLAALFSILISYLVLPYFNQFFETRIPFNLLTDPKLIGFSILLILLVTFLSGAYPSMILARFRPVLALKGKFKGKYKGGFNIRRVLMVTQFTISQVLLIGLIVMLYQMKYFKNGDMGFDRNAVVMIPIGPDQKNINTIRTEFSNIPQVQHVTACFGSPATQNHWQTTFRYDNRPEAEGFPISARGADENYLATFGLELVAGRNISASDTIKDFLVNEKFVEKLGVSSPELVLGKRITVNGDWGGTIVGVVKNFHDQSFRSEIEPIFITTATQTYNSFAVKINMANASNTLATLGKTWSNIYPDLIFRYDFLDDQIAEFYKVEEVMMTMLKIFASIALFIVCMGLYGLVSFMAVQKTKEIGIRKVLGGSISQMLWIFGKEFSTLVIIAFFVAAPVGWLLMSKWLSNYPYRVNIEFWIFILELVIIFGVVLITAGYRSLRAAKANPVKSLRSE